MAYFALLWKARTIEKYRSRYEKEKIDSIVAANVELPRHTFGQKWKLYRYDSQRKINSIFRRLCPEGSKTSNFFVYLKTDQTFVNFLVKSVIGFVGGIVLTYFWFMFFVFQLSISLIHATIMSSIIGVALTLGLAFSYRVRCLVFLLIPQFFSRVGRYTLTCYALVLILTGPATNTMKNSEVLSESLACGQEQVKTSVTKISKSMEKPLHLIKDTMDETMKKLKQLAAKMKELMVRIHRLTMSIAHVLQSSLTWLTSVEGACNAQLGSPYEHCLKVLSQGKGNPNLVKALLNFDDLVKAACFDLKSVDSMCVVGEYAKSSIVATVKKKLQIYSNNISSIVSVNARVRRTYGCCNSSAVNQATAGTVTEIRRRADPVLTWLSWSACLTSLFLLLIIFRAKYYQQMFQTRSRFDNRYVTKELRDLDFRRLKQGRDTVLPLNTRERAKYVSTTSFRLLASERVHLTRSIVFMVITTFKLMIHMVADYSLYWVLMNIRFHGRFQSPMLPGDPTAGIQVAGAGPLAGIVRALLEALSIPLAVPAPSPLSCLPNPHPPDFQRYAQIGILILLLWLLALLEPYGLRLRHVIMSRYQPERARARARWLHNHIIRTRGSFLKYARRKLHREYKYSSEERYTFRRWLNNFIPCRCIRFLLRIGPEEPRCLLCGTKHIQNDSDTYLKRCDTPSCPGVYCARCFTDIGQLCTICLSPEDYGDLSDVSLEKGSSDDDSDNSDNDDEGENKPLIGKPASEEKEHDKFLPRNPNSYNYQRLPKEKINDIEKAIWNFETTKQYAYTNHDFIQEYKYQEVDDSPKTKNEQLDRDSTIPVVIRDKERLLKNMLVSKDKVKGVINTMKLLTTKMADSTFNNQWNTHESKTFEYIVMNLREPVDVFKKALIVRQTKLNDADSRLDFTNKGGNESLKQLVSFLCAYSMNGIGNNRIEDPDPIVNDFPADLNVENYTTICRTDFESEEKADNELKVSKRDTKLLKRFIQHGIDARISKTEYVTEKLVRKRRIQLIRTKRRHSICHYTNTSVKYTKIDAKFRVYKIGKATFTRTLPSKINKFLIANKCTSKSGKCLEEKRAITEDIKCYVRNKSQELSNNVSSNIKMSDLKDYDVNENPNDMKSGKKENSTLKTIYKASRNRNEKHGFFSHLWIQTKIAFEAILRVFFKKPNPILPKKLANHKRRKKRKIVEQNLNINTPKALVNKDNDARKFRLSLYFEDQEWCKKKTDQKVFKEDKPIPKPKVLNESISNFLIKLKDKTKKRADVESEIKIKAAREKLVQELKRKSKAEEKLKRKLKREANKHTGLKNTQLVHDPQKVNEDKKIPNEYKPVEKKIKTTLISTTSEKVNSLTPILEESFKDKHPHAPAGFEASNCLNFYGLNEPVDLPEENIDLDRIFAEDDKKYADNVKEKCPTTLICYQQKRKIPQRPIVWPRDRVYTIETKSDKRCEPNKSEPNISAAKEKENGWKIFMPRFISHRKAQDGDSKEPEKEILNEKFQEDDPIDDLDDDDDGEDCNEEEVKASGDVPVITLIDCLSKSTTDIPTKGIKVTVNGYPKFRTEKTMKNTGRAEVRDRDRDKVTQAQLIKLRNCEAQCDSLYCVCGLSVGVTLPTLRHCQNEKSTKADFGKSIKKRLGVRSTLPTPVTCSCATQCECDTKVDFGMSTVTRTRDRATQCDTHCHVQLVDWSKDNAAPKTRDDETRDRETQHEGKHCPVVFLDYSGEVEVSPKSTQYDDKRVNSCDATSRSGSETVITDSTNYNNIMIDYTASPRKAKAKNMKIVRMTKANRSTLTEKSRSVDASTVTSDWWSPIVEKKTQNNGQGRDQEKKGAKAKDENYVSFNSYAHVFPRYDSNILTPSRYLLESQKYYNELFSSDLFSLPFHLKMEDKRNDPQRNFSGKSVRKTLKTKRLEESYSPQKQTQTSHFNLKSGPTGDMKDRPSHLQRGSRNCTTQVGRKSRTRRDTHDKGIEKVFKRSGRLPRSKSFFCLDKDMVGYYDSTGSN